MPEQKRDSLDHLDPTVLAKIAGLELRARLVVEGFFTGMHHSPHHGVSIEFADHRQYTQGDDLRHIDWKVFGRTDKYYIKEYEQESNLNLLLAVDASESMGYRSAGAALTKYEYAATAAAAIAYLALQQQDSIGLALFDERITQFLRPSSSLQNWQALVHELSVGPGSAKTSVGEMLTGLAKRLSQRTLIILISDLFDQPDEILKGLKRIRYRRHEPIVWQVWDPAELTFPFRNATMFEGLEEAGSLLTDPPSLRDRYLVEVRRFQSLLRSACGHAQVDYAVFDTSKSLGTVLSSFLATRNTRLRTRSSRVLG